MCGDPFGLDLPALPDALRHPSCLPAAPSLKLWYVSRSYLSSCPLSLIIPESPLQQTACGPCPMPPLLLLVVHGVWSGAPAFGLSLLVRYPAIATRSKLTLSASIVLVVGFGQPPDCLKRILLC
jgi:hypothetical protein